jgi:hypothetical protein
MQRDNSGHQHNTLTMKQKQIQKENTTLKRVLIVTEESDVNLALKVALEQVEGAHYYLSRLF